MTHAGQAGLQVRVTQKFHLRGISTTLRECQFALRVCVVRERWLTVDRDHVPRRSIAAIEMHLRRLAVVVHTRERLRRPRVVPVFFSTRCAAQCLKVPCDSRQSHEQPCRGVIVVVVVVVARARQGQTDLPFALDEVDLSFFTMAKSGAHFCGKHMRVTL